ncbi:MAG: 4'-phosphopantetheinyl transferase superfamily protein [Anaerotignum sp.]|nr:4'-phosphopantetheinyl transferase superfamily protein [Anaerotignum sp.]
MKGILYMKVDILEDQALFDKWFSLISLNRKEHIIKLKNPVSARLSLGAGILLRIAMEKFGYISRLNDIEYGTHGKPYLKDVPFYFSLSHSGEYAICVYSAEPVGADLQIKKKSLPKHTRKILSSDESIYLNSLGENKQIDVFFSLWARKESIIKWDGRGLRIPMNEINTLKEKVIFEAKELILTEFSTLIPQYAFSICSTDKFIPEEIIEITSESLIKY